MGAIGLADGQVWGASGSAVVMLLRFALGFASTVETAQTIETAIAMNGLGIDLSAVDDAELADDLRRALMKGSFAMRDHLSGLIGLAEEFEMMLGTVDE